MVSCRDTSKTVFSIQNEILVSRGYRDTANFRPCYVIVLYVILIVIIIYFKVVATTKKNANVALIFSFLHKLVKVHTTPL